jgi:hypothetical protein
MADAVAGFEWDDSNVQKCQRHGVAIAEIEAFFRGSPRVVPDERHSEAEDRFVAVGRDSQRRPMFVVFTIRWRSSQRLIRPISARRMHKKEIEGYEQA